MNKKDLGLITAVGVDPLTLDALVNSAKRNRMAMTRKQRYDQQRIRVRTEVPEPVRDLLREVARGIGTSVSDLGAYLLCVGLALYYEESEEVHGLLDFVPSKSPKKDVEVCLTGVMDRLQKAVAKAAKGAASVKDDCCNGADDGADEWSHWPK